MIQGLALAFGPLTLVQPLAAADVLFALPMIAVLRRYRLTRGDWIGAFAVAGGLAVFLAVAPPAGGEPARVPRAWAPVLLAATAVTAVSVAAAARTRGAHPRLLRHLCGHGRAAGRGRAHQPCPENNLRCW